MSIIGIIPARYASTRFPGKPLIQIQGKSMLQRVYEQSSKAKLLNEIIIATDDRGIEEHAKGDTEKQKVSSYMSKKSNFFWPLMMFSDTSVNPV